MKIISNDILKIKEGLICHQVNCMGKMGTGIALAIRQKWLKSYEDYIQAYEDNQLYLGNVIISRVDYNLFVAHCCGQYKYGRDKRYTDYKALKQCFEKVKEWSNIYRLQVYIPYKMGCNNAGGKWKVVSEIIEEIIPESVVCKKGY